MVDKGSGEGDEEIKKRAHARCFLSSMECGVAERATGYRLQEPLDRDAWVLTRVEVAVRSRMPESRPARNMTLRVVVRSSAAVLSGARSYYVIRIFRCLVGWWEVGCGEECATLVLWAHGRWCAVENFEGPGDVEGGIVPEDGAFTSGIVEIGGLVEDFGRVGQDEEAMGEAFGDPKELEVVVGRLGFEVESGPFAEVGGVAAEVDGDIPDMAGEDADEFALGLAELVVQAPEYAFDRERLVVLNELRGKTSGGKS